MSRIEETIAAIQGAATQLRDTLDAIAAANAEADTAHHSAAHLGAESVIRAMSTCLDALDRATAGCAAIGGALQAAQTAASTAASRTATPTGASTAKPPVAARRTLPDPPPGSADFHPGLHHGPLGTRFRPGVHDPDRLFESKERAIGDWLAASENARVDPRPRDDTTHGKKNPDAMIRHDERDWGTVTEFKTLHSGSSRAVHENIKKAASQLRQYGGGDVVIDGREAGLTEGNARRGHARTAGELRERNKPMPRRVVFILSGGSHLTLRGSDVERR